MRMMTILIAALVLAGAAHAQFRGGGGLGAADPSQQLRTTSPNALGLGYRPVLPEKKREPLVTTEPPSGPASAVTTDVVAPARTSAPAEEPAPAAVPARRMADPVRRAAPRVADPAPAAPVVRDTARQGRINDLLDRVKQRRGQR